MNILDLVTKLKPEECRELGELIVWLADRPRDASFYANIDLAMSKFQDPAELSQVAVLQRARERVQALNDGLLADGMNHQKLIADELARRGDDRPVDEYCRSVLPGGRLPHSDVIHGDIARD